MFIAVSAALILVFYLLPTIALTLLLFGRKRITDFDCVGENFKWSTYFRFREKIISSISEMRQERFEEVSIESNGAVMRAEFIDRGSLRTAILLHGFCSTPLNNFSIIGLELLKKGYNLLLVYQRGHNRSEGRFTTLGSMEQYDLIKWIEWVEGRVPEGSILLYGISMGGAAIGLASNKIDSKSVKAMVLDCCLTSAYSQMMQGGKAARILKTPFVAAIGLFTKLFMGLNIYSDIRSSLKQARIPALFIGGGSDERVPAALIGSCNEACASESRLIIIDSAPHALAFAAANDAERAEILGFIEEHLNNNTREEQ